MEADSLYILPHRSSVWSLWLVHGLLKALWPGTFPIDQTSLDRVTWLTVVGSVSEKGYLPDEGGRLMGWVLALFLLWCC